MKTVLFDFDYTLADSSKAIVACLSYALKSLDLPISSKELMFSTIGMPLVDTFALLAPGAAPQTIQSLIELFRDRADQIMVSGTKLYDSVFTVIKALKKQGYLLGIISTKYRFRIEAILERDRLLAYFNVIIGGEDVVEHKPDPEGLLKAIDHLHCDKQSVIYIGDSVIDVQTAIAAGVDFIGVTSGATSKNQLQKFGAQRVLGDLSELTEILINTSLIAWSNKISKISEI
jgi:phosphoglycolate phosphatase